MARAPRSSSKSLQGECLRRLPALPLEPEAEGQRAELRRAELRQSMLAIAELSHVTESALVRAAVKNALGHLPSMDE